MEKRIYYVGLGRRESFSNVVFPISITCIFSKYQKNMKKNLLESCDSHKDSAENSDRNRKSFAGFFQKFPDKILMTLNGKASVAYPIYAIFLNFSIRKSEGLIRIGAILVRFLLVHFIDADLWVEVRGEINEMSSNGFRSSITAWLLGELLIAGDLGGIERK